METFRLISMIDFILQTKNDFVYSENAKYEENFKQIVNYAEFLKQSLTLGMFVPVDEKNNPMLAPGSAPDYTNSVEYIDKFKEAKEKVLFSGIKIKHRENYFILEDEDVTWLRVLNKNTSLKVEDLLKISNIELTPSALKTIGL